MNGNYLLDTNILIAVFREEPAVLSRLHAPNLVLVSTIALGELYYGAC